ncbi:MAG: hypothetical protein ACE5OY_06515 [Candidatus Bathyarchaeia archaeon]
MSFSAVKVPSNMYSLDDFSKSFTISITLFSAFDPVERETLQ